MQELRQLLLLMEQLSTVLLLISHSQSNLLNSLQNVSVKNATYAGGLPVKPEVLIQIGGSTLVEGKDYTLRLIDKNGNTVTPIDVTVGDIYGVEIKGINGYTESGVATFDTDDVDSTAYSRANLTWGVDKKNINDCTVTVKMALQLY